MVLEALLVHDDSADVYWRNTAVMSVNSALGTTVCAEGVPSGYRILNRPLQILFVIVLLHSVWAMSVGWSHTIMDQYGFRQAQTAITVDSISRGGPWLNYETPVLGPPWSIPFEFPLYQWVAALLVIISRMPVDQACRLTSVSFFYLSLIPLYLFLRRLGLSRQQTLPFLILILTSPTYLFWSRAALIESCSVFLGATYLWLSARYLDRPTGHDALCVAAAGSLAAMVKVTTFCGFALCTAFLFIGAIRTEAPRRRFWSRSSVSRSLVLFLVPLGAGYSWTAYADFVKAHNPLAGFLISSALNSFTFGPLKLRVGVPFWSTMWSRSIPDILGSRTMLALMVLTLPLLRKKRIYCLASVVAFLSGFLVFANLQFVHKYYQYEIGIFLIGAVAFSVAELMSEEGPLVWCAAIMLAIGVVANLWQYHLTYFDTQTQNNLALTPTARAIDSRTKPNDTLLIYGLDWSSELPYYSERRAIMLRGNEGPDDLRVRASISNLKDSRLGAMAVCSGARTDLLDVRERVAAFDMEEAPGYEDSNCTVYFASVIRRRTGGIQRETASVPTATLLGSLDLPKQGMIVKGVLEVGGWAIADPGIAEAAVYIDGIRLGTASLRIPRPDVQKAYPNAVGSLNSGFAGSVGLAGIRAGLHLVSVRVRLGDGSVREAGRVSVEVRTD